MPSGEPKPKLRVLLLTGDPGTRDVVSVGLRQFDAFTVDWRPEAPPAPSGAVGQHELIVLDGTLAERSGGLDIVRALREAGEKAEVILLVPERAAKQVAKEKSAYDVFAVLPLPLEGAHFFKTIVRVKDRLALK
jgi:DNA-binding response OmpR family regulator